MPYYHFYGERDEEAADGDMGSVPSGAFEFEQTTGTFKADDLSAISAAAVKLLLSAAIAEMRICYDGGNDEGFAHADDMWLDGDRKSLDEVIDLLNTPSHVEWIIAAAAESQEPRGYNLAEHYRPLEPREVIATALEGLADEVASQLLGVGYGTGDYELYGAVVVNFETGQMTDDPSAGRPPGRM